MIELRPYQSEAVDALFRYFERADGHPLVEMPTASGKSLTMAGFVKDAIDRYPDTRVLLATHRKELIEQDAAAIRKLWPDAPVGIYSAGLHSRQVRRITVAGVQTVHKKAAELGHVSLLLIDECFTAETLIETTRGLVRIDNVRPGDYVYCATGIGEIRAVRSRPASDVVTVRFADGHKVRCTPDHRFFTADGWIPARQLAGKVPLDQEAVRLLREGVWPNSLDQLSRQRARDERGAMEQASVLLAILREEDEKPDEQQSGTAQDEGAAPGDQAQADQTWWERTTVPALTTGTPPRVGRGMGGRGGGSGWNGEGERLPDLLQDRHRQRREENRDRSRRREPLRDREARTGCKEDGFSRLPRVVSVSREQRGSVEAVFNLHVSGHPSYFANGRLVHNCHLIPHAGDGMYRRLIRDLTETNPALKIVGFTATPYRLSGGLLTRGAGHIFTSIAYKIPVQRLVDEGWLTPLVSPSTSTTYSTEGVGTVNGDFAVGELQSSVDKQEAVTRAALAESLDLAKERRAGIVFCVSVQHALLAASVLRERGETCAMITGDTDDLTRASSLSRFKRGEVRWLVGVDVLTTGFDAPITDVIVILRPTQSAGLYVQICGRGMRLHPEKSSCIVLDYGGNVERHGPITDIRHKSLAAGESKMVKECPNCMAEVKISKRECPECGFIFPEQPRNIDHDKQASRKAIMGPAPEPVWVEIDDVRASEWVKRAKEGEAPKPPTVCVEYLRGGRAVVKEWLCPEHGGYAAQKFCRWWFDAGGDLPAPHTVALTLERFDELKRIEAVQVGKDGQYDRVLARRFGDVVKAEATTEPVEDFGEIPF